MRTCDEWASEFDLLYDNISSGQAPGLLPYEKSVFLTRAEENIVLAVYNGTYSGPFEATEEATQYLASLVAQEDCEKIEDMESSVSGSSVFYALPEDMLLRTLEICKVETPQCGEIQASVIPVTQDEYWRTVRNPFKGAARNRVLRLTSAETYIDEDGVYKHRQAYSELISKYPVISYTVRYIRKPNPIILEDLSEGQSINGETKARTCELDEHLHSAILLEAVRLAKAIWAA